MEVLHTCGVQFLSATSGNGGGGGSSPVSKIQAHYNILFSNLSIFSYPFWFFFGVNAKSKEKWETTNVFISFFFYRLERTKNIKGLKSFYRQHFLILTLENW